MEVKVINEYTVHDRNLYCDFISNNVEYVKIDSLSEPLSNLVYAVKKDCFYVNFKYYYPMDNNYLLFDLPYVLKNNNYIWNVAYKNVSIQDFINTHNINIEDGIHIHQIESWGRGDGLTSIVLEWIKFFIDNRENMYELYSVLKYLFKISNGFIEKYAPKLKTFLCLIEKNNEWDSSMLSKQLDIDKNVLEILLKKFGYYKTSKGYVIDEKRNKKLHKKIEKRSANREMNLIYDINASIVFLDYMKEKFQSKYNISSIYDETIIEEDINSITENTVILKKGKGLKRIERVWYIVPSYFYNEFKRIEEDLGDLYIKLAVMIKDVENLILIS